MHVILTHEQADFDALASELGAYLLYERAIPVLPRRMNRNVRAFLAVYGAELPFVDPRDLPGGPIKKITLVDTQSMISLKGMSADTQVEVIDHHPLREGLPQEWSLCLQEIGATSTSLVEALHEHNGLLTPIQATLILMGIYEDTGSLTYSRTTARDLRAAAMMIEQGANLSIASNFLNHPLSPSQQVLYDRLRASAEYINLHGYNIIVTDGHAPDMEEELSSIAHKLRDLLDPDAIFVIVTTRGGVQLIARSMTDNIDVAALASSFGGGGHERASAALIRGKDLDEVRAELVGRLPEFVRPAISVAQIMSRGAQVLSKETTVQEAARRMRLFGYEGYPVVDQGKVVGLLTRRAVDRAMAHRLDYTAEQLMERGSVVVRPDDSIEYLQRLVAETGWGQIPVVDSGGDQVIGIVTRTDLLKNLVPGLSLPGRQNLAARMEQALPQDRMHLLKLIAEEAHRHNAALYVVGGFVRDLLMEKPSLDFDLVVEGDAIGLAKALAMKYGGRVTGHARFGTAKWLLDEPGEPDQSQKIHVQGLQTVDLISARTEFYTHPSALPTVERGSIKLDLHRRDFTINTLAMRLDGRYYGELFDYWGGLNDLRQGFVRVLHSLSFVDDPTRILRAVRFEQRFAFRIEERTMELLLEARPLIDRLSGDRIRHELNHIMDEASVAQIMSRLNSLGLIQAIHRDLQWDDWLFSQIEGLKNISPDPIWGIVKSGKALERELGFILWMIQLLPEQSTAISRRLKLPVQLAETIRDACRLWNSRTIIREAAPSEVVTYLDNASNLAVFALFIFSSDTKLKNCLLEFGSRWKKMKPITDGEDLHRLGIPPGPKYREILTQLRNAWLDGLVQNEEEEKSYLDSLLKVVESS